MGKNTAILIGIIIWTAAEVNLFPIGNGDDFCSGEGTDKSLNYILHQTYSGNEYHAFIVNFVSNVLED